MENFIPLVLSLVACLVVLASSQRTENLIIDGYEAESIKDGEVAFPDGAKDKEYFANLDFTREEIPATVPVEDEVLEAYSEQLANGTIELAVEKQVQGDRTVVPCLNEAARSNFGSGNLYVYYYQNYLDRYRRWCPRSQSYQCSSDVTRLPCFKVYRSGRWGVCCPLWPQIYISRCNCGQCTRLCENCVQTGTCVNNYSYKWFIAVCYNLGFWNRFLVFNQYLPTSCSCNAPQCS